MSGRVWCDRCNRAGGGCERCATTSALIAHCITEADRVSFRLIVFAKLSYTAGNQWKGRCRCLRSGAETVLHSRMT